MTDRFPPSPYMRAGGIEPSRVWAQGAACLTTCLWKWWCGVDRACGVRTGRKRQQHSTSARTPQPIRPARGLPAARHRSSGPRRQPFLSRVEFTPFLPSISPKKIYKQTTNWPCLPTLDFICHGAPGVSLEPSPLHTPPDSAASLYVRRQLLPGILSSPQKRTLAGRCAKPETGTSHTSAVRRWRPRRWTTERGMWRALFTY